MRVATLALILGRGREARSLAGKTMTACRRMDPTTPGLEDRFWVMVRPLAPLTA